MEEDDVDIRMRWVTVAAMAGLALAACGGGGESGDVPLPSRPSSTAAAAPTTADDQPATSSAPRDAGTSGATSTDRSRPAAPGSPAWPGADRAPKTSSVRQGSPVLIGVRTGRHPGYTRYVFDFVNDDPEGHSPLGSARPGWDVRYVPPAQAVQDGSGDPPPVGGAVYLRIRFEGAAAHYDDGSPSIRYGLDAHSPLGFGGDFEGRVTWFLGLDNERPFRVLFIENNRVAVDVADAP
ncbi:MAG: hypothetical protein M3133_07015 [Actinomycetota bacterium]|nr:hypothetical protein [Actinomycetota bacterium]